MSKDHAQISCKRSANTIDNTEPPPPKRSKNTSIMDYMKPRPQSRSKPPRKQQNDSSETTSKYWPKQGSSTRERQTSSATGSKNDHEAKSSPDEKTEATNSSSAAPEGKINRHDIPSNDTKTLNLNESIGDIFSAPPQTLIIHACNCEGSWGAGIAAAFRIKYPAAYKIYAAHCREHGSDLFGTALLIPPQKPGGTMKRNPHFVGCLFTSRSKGRKKDSPKQILNATGPAMIDLMAQVRQWDAKVESGRSVGEVRMCKINSGLFAVPWEETKAVMEGIAVDEGDFQEVEVTSREE